MILFALFISVALGVSNSTQRSAAGLLPQPHPPGDIVRVRTGTYCGMCTASFRESEMVVERGRITEISKSGAGNPRIPTKARTGIIEFADWSAFRHYVADHVLAELTGSIECPGCLDERVEWVTVELRDRTTKSVYCNARTASPCRRGKDRLRDGHLAVSQSR